MLNDLDERVAAALKKLAEAKDCISKADDLESRDISSKNNIVNLLIDRDLAKRLEDTIYHIGEININIPTCKISPKGINIIKNGGWLKHLDHEKTKSTRAERKEIFDYNIAKWQSRTFWPVLIFGLFGGIYSGIELYQKLTTKNVNQESKSTIEKHEHKSSSNKSDELILNQNKIDTLSKTKNNNMKRK